MDINTRDLAFSDLDALLALYEELHPDDYPSRDRAALEDTWSKILADPAHIYLGGFGDGTLVTTCNAAIVPNLTRGARPYAVIENVVTAAAVRRRGVGSSVPKELITRCWARRCYKIMLMSATTRSDIHAFYDSLGFDRTAKQAFVMTSR